MDTLVSTPLILQLPLRRSQREVRLRLLGWARQDEKGDLQMAAGSGSDGRYELAVGLACLCGSGGTLAAVFAGAFGYSPRGGVRSLPSASRHLGGVRVARAEDGRGRYGGRLPGSRRP